MSFSSTRQSFVVALVATIGSQMPSAANTPSGSQGEVVRADSIPVIVGPTVLAIVPGKLDSVAPALRRVREMASALGYTFVVAPETVPAYLRTGQRSGIAVYIPDGQSSGYALVSPSRTPEFVRGLAPTANLRRSLRGFLRPQLLAWYFDLWPIALLSAVVVVASLTSVFQRKEVWIGISIAAGALSLALVAPTVLARWSNPFHNVLVRDVVALLVLAAGIPLLVSGTAVGLADRHLAYRLFIPFIVSVVCIAGSFLLLLLVHCTSGDCL